MKKLKRKETNYMRLIILLFYLVIVILLLLGGLYLRNKKEQPLVKPVSGKEEVLLAVIAPEKPVTWDQVVIWIVEEFSEFGPKVTKQALEIAFCESGWRPDAYNDKNTNLSIDRGPFQINSVHIKRFGIEAIKDPLENIKIAKQLYKEQKWNPWYCKAKVGIK